MRDLWNELVSIFEKAVNLDTKDEANVPQLSKEDRQAVYLPLQYRKTVETEKNVATYQRATELWTGSVPSLHLIGWQYKGVLPSACYEAVIARFLVTVKEWSKAPKVKGPPRRKFGLDQINVPLVFNEGKPTDWLSSDAPNAPVGVRFVPKEDRKILKQLDLGQYLRNGFFEVGVNRERIDLHVAVHRTLPAGRIKRVSLVCRREQAFGWAWSLQVQVEHPALPTLPTIGRIAGLDLGWRVREDGLRLGVLTTSDGQSIEISLPFLFGNREARKNSKWIKAKNIEDHTILDWRDLWRRQAAEGEWLELCKQKLAALPDEEREKWPEDARQTWTGRVKMRDGGLRRLLRMLREANTETEAIPILEEWDTKARLLRRRIRGAQLTALQHRDDHYRKLADWLARSFDALAWEGDLGLKEMAEDDSGEPALENAKTYRHLANLHTLRLYVRQAFAKHGRELKDCKTAWTNRCFYCDAYIEPTSKLLAVCENGHKTDIDRSASTFLLNQLEAPASTPVNTLEIPGLLRRYLRAMG